MNKEELFANSDVITIHYGMSDRSRGMIGETEFLQMKENAYIVNTSRSPIIDQEALYKALTSDSIAGAALDVYTVEPLPADDRFRKLDNALLTPHLGYVTIENHAKHYTDIVENIAKFMDGDPVRILRSG